MNLSGSSILVANPSLDILLDTYNIVLYAKNYEGYKNIIKLSTIQNEKKVLEEDLYKYNKNVVAIIPYKYKEKFTNLKEIYSEIYLGYTTKKEKLEAKIITNNIVFFRENLYLSKNDSTYLSYLYKIRDGKTVSDDIYYETENHELEINNILDLTDVIYNFRHLNCYCQFMIVRIQNNICSSYVKKA